MVGAEKSIGATAKIPVTEGGSALIVRAGGEDLLPEHLEAMCVFCEKGARFVLDCVKLDGKNCVKQLADEHITKEK